MGDISRFRIEAGTASDYARLGEFHYLAGKPATIDLILRARWSCGTRRELAGILVVSRPMLFGWWRELAWPGRYTPRRDGPPRRLAAQRLNAEVRTISRVIVDPRFRAAGVASSLVRAYLAKPLTPRTEAAAAMGDFCPFFARAGMKAWTASPDAFSVTLARWLARRGLGPADLIAADRAKRLFARPRLGADLRRFASRSLTTARYADQPATVLAAALAAKVWAPRLAYTAASNAALIRGIS